MCMDEKSILLDEKINICWMQHLCFESESILERIISCEILSTFVYFCVLFGAHFRIKPSCKSSQKYEKNTTYYFSILKD